MLNDEKELLGFYVSGHPLDRWRSTLASQAFRKLGFIDEIPEKDLFEPGVYPWQGKHPLAGFIKANTCNHYRWANQKIRLLVPVHGDHLPGGCIGYQTPHRPAAGSKRAG